MNECPLCGADRVMLSGIILGFLQDMNGMGGWWMREAPRLQKALAWVRGEEVPK